ncbi:ATP11 protein-domain-containing protein [Entophlyctis helioformis]|nr:ATP11 protein-domain-containing protein [Entophlyctis helioformis]
MLARSMSQVRRAQQLRRPASASTNAATVPGASAAPASRLTAAQMVTARQFATLSTADWLNLDQPHQQAQARGKPLTYGDVLSSILFSRPATAAAPSAGDSVEEQLAAAEETAVQRQFREKYEEKLQRKAQEAGFATVDDMLERKKLLDKKLAEHQQSQSNKSNNSNNSNDGKDGKKDASKSKAASALPSYAKTLDQIVKVELLEKESPTSIADIWNKYHSAKTGLSASIDAAFYQKLHERGRQFPMFVLPLPRNEGYELFFMQFSGHQTYYTPLLEYKTNGAMARPSLVLTHYVDMAASKGIVLMVGELGDPSGGNLSILEAQNLVYQTQLFYSTGTKTQMDLVETFSNSPQTFSYEELIKAVETLA